jgi:RNA polymerase sigma factor (sigma-70 family)
MASLAPEIPVLARDQEFEALYRRYVKDVYHYAFALLRNPADAEDVTQTTFMNAYRAYRRGDEILKPQNWLIKIAHNVARTRYARMSRRVKEVPLDDHVDQLALPEEERPNIEGVLRALGRLPFNQRAALIMRELEGRTYAEIADTLGVSVAAVETLIFRARRSLRVRAAALKSIGLVPLPSSLTQLFEGGGAVAGGVGAGFAVKAAVALVAGALATGLGGDHGSRAVAASHVQAGPAAAAPHAGATTPTRHQGRVSNAQRVASARVATPVDKIGARAVGAVDVRRSSLHRTARSVSSPQASGRISSPSVAETVSNTVGAVVGTAEQAAADVTAALPVNAPSLPSIPVQAPPLPKLP